MFLSIDNVFINKLNLNKMKRERFNPAYNDPQQVKNCTGADVAKVAIVIGYVPTKDGGKLVTSTDWRLKMVGGETAVFQFSIHPNYTSFVECKAGANYEINQFGITNDPTGHHKPARVIIGDSVLHFEPEERLIVYPKKGEKFIATDCEVEVVDDRYERVYRVIIDDDTEYGVIDEKGRISRL